MPVVALAPITVAVEAVALEASVHPQARSSAVMVVLVLTLTPHGRPQPVLASAAILPAVVEAVAGLIQGLEQPHSQVLEELLLAVAAQVELLT
jgi:hypothetical protein